MKVFVLNWTETEFCASEAEVVAWNLRKLAAVEFSVEERLRLHPLDSYEEDT